jgi:hypothetical protein
MKPATDDQIRRAELEQCLLYEGFTAEEAKRIAGGMLKKYPRDVAAFIRSSQQHKNRYTN